MSNTLILKPGGNGGCVPDPEYWKPIAGEKVTITNKSGSTQELLDIKNKCLKTKKGKPKKSISLKDGKSWSGKAGDKGVNGTYVYDDGEPAAGPRNGHIDPS